MVLANNLFPKKINQKYLKMAYTILRAFNELALCTRGNHLWYFNGKLWYCQDCLISGLYEK